MSDATTEDFVISDDVAATYFDPAWVDGNGEELPDSMESPEYGEKRVWTPELPGKYISPSRELLAKDGYKARPRADGHFGFQFSTVLVNPLTQKVSQGFPFKLYIDTKPQILNEWNNGVPTARTAANGNTLMASRVSQYLRRFKDEDGKSLFDPKTKNLREIAEMVEASLSLPTGVVVGWREKSPKNEDGTYVQNYKHRTKAASYLVDGVYQPKVELDGVVYNAQAYIIDFCAIPTGA